MPTINQIKANADAFIRTQIAIDSIDQDDVADRTDDVADELLLRGIAGVPTTAAMSLLAGNDYKRAIVTDNGVFEWLAAGVIDGVDVFTAAGGGVWSRILGLPSTLDAFNGLSLDLVDNKYVLGQTVGDAGNPAELQDVREIPTGNFEVVLQSPTPAGATRIGSVAGGRTGIKITGSNGGRVATLWLTNADAATYKDFQWEHTTANGGMLVLNDATGNLWIINRTLVSLAAPFHTHQNVTDTPGTAFLGVTRPRNVVTNRGAVAAAIFTVPTPSAIQKLEYTFIQVNDFPITIQVNGAGEKIRVGAMITAAGGNITSGGIGSCIRLQWMVSAAEWNAIAIVGNWTTA
jgi:hypothetical protein